MKKGVVLFAYNAPKFNYYDMAVFSAKRINHFLDLPVTLITDSDSIPAMTDYTFDKVIITEADKENKREHGIWINKGRYQAFDISPYDETLLLDTDYLVNSNRLAKLFELPTDFCCHNHTSFLMSPGAEQEKLSSKSFNTLWATVIKFNKTKRAEQIFSCLKMVQHNFEHYANIHGFVHAMYRNDYGLTLAVRIANGHTNLASDNIPWSLVHVGRNTTVYKNNDYEFNTEYTVLFDSWKNSKLKKEYCLVRDFDFHVLNKKNFIDLMK